MHFTLDHVTSEIDKAIPLMIAAVLKLLLEEKHLYQSAVLDFESEFQKLASSLPPHEQSRAFTYGIGQLSADWHFFDPSSGSKTASPSTGTTNTRPILPPDSKLFCSTCNRIETFNCLSVYDCASAFPRALTSNSRPAIQVFLFSYLCQSCRTFPEAFLVRREHNRLILSGRAPIERTEVPSAIPKDVRRFYSGAIVAHQSGQTLAGLVLLRTLIEQWCKLASSGSAVQTDALLDEYTAALPEEFKTRVPLMSDLFSDLNGDIQSGTGSSDLFDSARDRLLVHFEARRLFKLHNGAA
jgi:hypothetical protein